MGIPGVLDRWTKLGKFYWAFGADAYRASMHGVWGVFTHFRNRMTND